MFGRSSPLEAQLATIAASFAMHVADCSQRALQNTKQLEKLEEALLKSTDERRASIAEVDQKVITTAAALEQKVEMRHKENRKYFWLLLLAAVPVFADKLSSWIGTLQHGVTH